MGDATGLRVSEITRPSFCSISSSKMMQAFYDSRQSPYKPSNRLSSPSKEEDTQQIASFLLSLKHRSVTPEPAYSEQVPPPYSHAPSVPYHPSYGHEYGSYGYDQHIGGMERTTATARPHSKTQVSTPSTAVHAGLAADVDFEKLLGDSKLVHTKDRDLVPDALFIAMAQMKPCRLTHADRVGCYKTRDLGFVGMCCKHCGGQPGFGRYYPNSVRSLAQTTTSQTILKHIGSKCRFCPSDVRNALLVLQDQQSAAESVSSGRPRYGSRKVFFQRVWSRLHEDKIPEEGGGGDDDDDEFSTQTPSDVDEEESTGSSDLRLEAAQLKRKNRFRTLSIQKSSKRTKMSAGRM